MQIVNKDYEKNVCISNLRKIGEGNTAEVYELNESKVIKLYREGYSESIAKEEYRKAKLMMKFPFSKAKTVDFLIIENRFAILYEMIYGISLERWVYETQNLSGCAKYLADLHKEILLCEIENETIEGYKNVISYFIKQADVSEIEKNKAIEILKHLPEGKNLCHGDYHPGNVMIDKEKSTVIDFLNICKGPQLYDIARTVYLIQYTPVPQGCDNIERMSMMREQVATLYLKEMGASREEIKPYLEVIFVARKGECPLENSLYR